jgi:riboflavin synthase
VIARYLERLLQGDAAAEITPTAGISEAFLAEHGFGPRS